MIHLFYEFEDFNVASCADDITPNACATATPSVALELQAFACKLFCWFKGNHLKAYPGKSDISLSTKKPEIVSIDEIPLATSLHTKIISSYIRLRIKV